MSEADYVCGIHAVNQLIVEKPRTLRRLLIATGRSDARIQGIREKAREAGIRVDQIDRRALERMTRDALYRARQIPDLSPSILPPCSQYIDPLLGSRSII